MSDDPLDRATSTPPPTLGEGCLSRYDPEAMDEETGTEFEDAAKLWDDLYPVEKASASNDLMALHSKKHRG